jgi:hypothetical protein
MSASPQQEEVRDKSQEDFEEEQQVEEAEGELPATLSSSVTSSLACQMRLISAMSRRGRR